jgi:hypothetical protein
VLAAGLALEHFSPTILADQFGALLTTANIFTYLFCFYLYWHGKHFGMKHERITNNVVYDFWLGTALNHMSASFQVVMRDIAATLKRVFLELGGKSAQVVFPDADLDGPLLRRDVGALRKKRVRPCVELVVLEKRPVVRFEERSGLSPHEIDNGVLDEGSIQPSEYKFESSNAIERDRAWPARSGKVVLQLALDRLARHYGYASQTRGPVGGQIRTWLADDAAFSVENG